MDQVGSIEPQPEKRDVSKQTLVVLVVLAVVVSLLGTFTVLRETNSVHRTVVLDKSTPAEHGGNTAVGTVSLNIVGPENEPKNTATGFVSLNIAR